MKVVKGAAKSKIIWLGTAVAALGYLQENREAIEPYIPEKWRGLVFVVLGLGIIVARFRTSQSLADKGAPKQ